MRAHSHTHTHTLTDSHSHTAVAVWLLVVLIARYLQWRHRRSRLTGYLGFYSETQMLRRLPLYILSLGGHCTPEFETHLRWRPSHTHTYIHTYTQVTHCSSSARFCGRRTKAHLSGNASSSCRSSSRSSCLWRCPACFSTRVGPLLGSRLLATHTHTHTHSHNTHTHTHAHSESVPLQWAERAAGRRAGHEHVCAARRAIVGVCW
jgi:hypothetical protein